uniref:Uncharacterized protein n=1 Tax=Candidatus Methanogaster sp. ANME-2c ERB4 TaxID=2759911 RepID=A0A7G9Y8N2_9EURY|nr:hypothetical protein CAHJBFHG_00002 [Methanosarcinales archaeon ANME-2c ERB4]
MKNKMRPKILKLSCIYGGVFSMILVGLYVFFLAAFIGGRAQHIAYTFLSAP